MQGPKTLFDKIWDQHLVGRRVDGRPTWTVTAGDPRTGIGLSLSPSIHHAAPQGCGWHGYLTNGVLRPC